MEVFLCYRFGGLYLEGLIHGGAYFRNFTLLSIVSLKPYFSDLNVFIFLKSPNCLSL